MVSVYSHITNQDAIDALAGEDMEEKIPEHKKKRECKICRTLNSTLSKFCAQCGHPLVEGIISRSSEEKVMKLVKFISKMAGKNPGIWDEIGRVTVELGDEATPSLAP